MKKTFDILLRTLASTRTMAVLFILYIAAMASATFTQRPGDFSSPYFSGWFILLEGLLAANFIAAVFVRKLYRSGKRTSLLLHAGFVVILIGAGITHHFGQEGTMHIREGQTANTIVSRERYLTCRVSDGFVSRNFKASLQRRLFSPVLLKEKHSFLSGSFSISVREDSDVPDRLNITIRTDRGKESRGLSLDPQNQYRGEVRLGEWLFSIEYAPVPIEVPFSVTLKKFYLHRYPGSQSPSSYQSLVEVKSGGQRFEKLIYMNNILRTDGYRLYQSSYDRDEKGTVLSVNRDRTGTIVTYIGYALLAAGMIRIFFSRNSRFRQLSRRLSRLSRPLSAAALAFLLSPASSAWAQSAPQPISVIPLSERIDPSYAEKFGRILVQSPKGRIEPMNTFSGELLQKIYRKGSFEGLGSDQVLVGMLSNPLLWSRVRLIDLPKSLREDFSANGTAYLCYAELFDGQGRYLLHDEVEEAYSKNPAERNTRDKDLLKLDERANILSMLLSGKLLNLFPDPSDPAHRWYPEESEKSAFTGEDSLFVVGALREYLQEVNRAKQTGRWDRADEKLSRISLFQREKASPEILPSEKKIQAEIRYNRSRIFTQTGRIYMALGMCLLGVLFVGIFRRESRAVRIAARILTWGIALTFLYQGYGLALRAYISGHAPWSNAYESMIYVGFACVLAGLLFARRSRISLALAALMGGFALFVADLNWMDPEITPLVPVLKSYWLMIHVAVITASYGFLGVCFLLGVLYLAICAFSTEKSRKKLEGTIEELTVINEMSMEIGLFLLVAGTFLGAVWANESWGRYWGWDPKETWSLITIIVYAFVLHMRLIPGLKGRYAFNLGSVIGMGSIVMTYFGVNYYLNGLHSYGNGDADPLSPVLFVFSGAMILLSAVAFWRNRQMGKEG